MVRERKVDVNALVSGEPEAPICDKCGCYILEAGCECSVASKQAPQGPQTAPDGPQGPTPPSTPADLFASIPGAPTQAEIETMKAAAGGKIFVTPFDADEVYIWRPLRYREWQQVQSTQNFADEAKMQEFIVIRAVLWPQMSPERINSSRAGLVPTLSQAILSGSHFLPLDFVLNMTREL